jgi:hypothetical protein
MIMSCPHVHHGGRKVAACLLYYSPVSVEAAGRRKQDRKQHPDKKPAYNSFMRELERERAACSM